MKTKTTKSRILAMFLCLCMVMAFLPAAAQAAPPKAALRDMQTHVWTLMPDEKPGITKRYVYSGGTGANAFEYRFDGLDISNRLGSTPAHLMLYDNGDLYLSRETIPSAGGFQKIMSNVREIGTFEVPLITTHDVISRAIKVGDSIGNYSEHYNDVSLERANLTSVLTESGDLYILGVPPKIPDEMCYFETEDINPDFAQMGSPLRPTTMYRFRETYEVDDVFPFPYSASPETPVKIASGVEHIVPGYLCSITTSHMDRGSGTSETQYSAWTNSRGFYIDDMGNSYFGFPTQSATNILASENIVGVVDPELYLTEDGVLHKEGKSIARDVKDFSSCFYLTNEGVLYDMDENWRISEVKVKALVKGASFASRYTKGRCVGVGVACITEDDSLLAVTIKGSTSKVMEDVAAVFGCRFAVRSNGDIYMLEENSDGEILPRKIISGSGIAPNPAPPLHAGKIFKDASAWALIDLRAARESGLTVPVDGLSYNKPITREKFAEVVVKLYESLSGKRVSAVTKDPFTDTDNPEILKAYSLGIVKGTSATKFSPKNPISREEIAVMLKRAVDAAGVRLPSGNTKKFRDAGQISSWAKEAVTAMTTANIIKGVSTDTFSPKGTTTVEQAVILSWRILSTKK